jgi:DNA-binding transcriptional ArsR family regulator
MVGGMAQRPAPHAPRRRALTATLAQLSALCGPESRAQQSRRGALGRVIGDARARLLTELDVPRSSTDLAKRTGLSAASVSEHLAALRDAGLVSSRRSGRYVLQTRTPRAEQLLSSE